MVGEYEEEFRRSVPPKGKLHKGVVLQPERTRSTIPTKVELHGPPKRHERPQSGKGATAKTEKAAFSASSRSRPSHFGQVVGDQQFTPGPGSYTSEVAKSDPSASKKGSGNGFASSTKRFPMVSPASKSSPAPGQYYDNKKDSSIRTAAPKLIPNYSENRELPEHEPTPGPGSYDPHAINYPESNPSGSAAFLSTDKRTQFLPEGGDKHSRRMGPGKYDYNDTRGRQVTVSSPFRSGTSQGLKFDSSSTPGPGHYRTSNKPASEKSPKVKPVPQGRILTSSVPTTVDTTHLNKRPGPGPGEYLPMSPSSPPASRPSPSAPPRIRARSVPNTRTSSSFASTTQRIELSTPSTAPTLGPGEYYAEAPIVKQSFHANRTEKWV